MVTPLHKAICLHIILSAIFVYLRPEYFFNDEGMPKHFGTGKECTPFSFYIIVTAISCAAFLLWSTFPPTV